MTLNAILHTITIINNGMGRTYATLQRFSDEGVQTEMFVAELLEITVVIYVCRVEVL